MNIPYINDIVQIDLENINVYCFYYNYILSILLQYAIGTYNQVVYLEGIFTLNKLLGKI